MPLRPHMDHSVTFARHFARLLWLLLNEPANIEEQKASLRALVTISRDGPVTLTHERETLLANGHQIGAAVTGARDTALRLAAHGAAELGVSVAAEASDLLEAARALAGSPETEGRAEERLRGGGSTTVHFRAHRTFTPTVSTLVGEFDLLIDDASTAPARTGSEPEAAPRANVADYAPPSGGSLFEHFATVQPAGGRDALLAELESTRDDALRDVLARVAPVAEDAQRRGDGPALLATASALIARTAKASGTAERELSLVLRRMLTSHTLRTIAALVPRRAATPEAVREVLLRAGEDGADAVIELLTQAPTATDRRAYFNLLLSLNAGIPTLMHMLDDDRWYVVRNAVDLLGELDARAAEPAILRLLDHADERVRQSATVALLRLNTPRGRSAVLEAVQSESPVIRQQAIAALGSRKDANTASMLLRALEHEDDEAVQRSILAALGRVASPDAVQRLIDAAAPGNGFFRRKPVGVRTAAVSALGEAATPAAVDALRRLVDDREREVRDAALRALARARRGNEPRVTGLFERIPEP